MALVALRRKSDGFIYSNRCMSFSGFRWVYVKPIHRTITGVSIPQKISVMERWWDATFEFDSEEDGPNSLPRLDRLYADANDDEVFEFVDIDGAVYDSYVVNVPEPIRLNLPDVHVLDVPCTFKQLGYFE